MYKKTYTRPLLSVIAAIFLSLAASCSFIRPQAPEINLASIKITGITLSNAELVAGLNVYNPNGTPITIKEVDYELAMGGVNVSRGRSIKALKIGAMEKGQIYMSLSNSYWDIIKILNGSKGDEDISFVLEGRVIYTVFGLSDIIYSFTKRGVLPVSLPKYE